MKYGIIWIHEIWYNKWVNIKPSGRIFTQVSGYETKWVDISNQVGANSIMFVNIQSSR